MFCRHFEECGGCSFQDISYEKQLAGKQKFVESLFANNPVNTIIPSPKIWNYRNSVELTFSDNIKKKTRSLGFHKGRSVFNVQECLIAQFDVEKIVPEIMAWWEKTEIKAFYHRKQRGTLATLTLKKCEEEMVVLTISDKGTISQVDLNSFVQIIKKTNRSIYLIVKHAKKGMSSFVSEIHLYGNKTIDVNLCNNIFKVGPQTFCQPNTAVANKMLDYCKKVLNPQPSDKLLDLYCGMGVIGITIAKYITQVIGMEVNPYSVLDAAENIKRLKVENVQIYRGDVSKDLKKILPYYKPNILTVNPPRSGIETKTLDLINQIHPKKILYISCNPKTQLSNIEQLKEYTIASIAPFDQCPHTPHIENIILLISNRN